MKIPHGMYGPLRIVMGYFWAFPCGYHKKPVKPKALDILLSTKEYVMASRGCLSKVILSSQTNWSFLQMPNRLPWELEGAAR